MSIVTSTGYQLEIGDLSLMENVSDSYELNLLADEATFGNGVTVREIVNSLMSDGDLTRTTRYGNRTASFLLQIKATDHDGLAAGEAAFEAEMDKPNTLSWHIPYGPTSAFDVVVSSSDFLFDDFAETTRIERTFRLTFECLPFARSVEPRTFTWTGPNTELASVLADYTVGAGSGTAANLADITFTPYVGFSGGGTGTRVFTVTGGVTLDAFLGFALTSSDATIISAVTVNGVVLSDVGRLAQKRTGADTYPYYVVYDVSAWRGQTVTLSFTMQSTGTGGGIKELLTTGYPNLRTPDFTEPPGIGVVSVVGTARAPATLRFTAPAGGAFVYTSPDPAAAIRERGAPELKFAHFTVASADGETVSVGATTMWFPQGTHSVQVGRSAGQPLELNPGGVWPDEDMLPDAGEFVYPADTMAAVSFFDTTGDKALISPSPALPQGYVGDAVVAEPHVLHPGYCGFGVLDEDGQPIETEVTYYPRWKHHAAE